MHIRKPTLRERVSVFAGRFRYNPLRESIAYARIMSIGSVGVSKHRPLIKSSPANLRKFSHSVYARRAINRIKNSILACQWTIEAKQDVKESPLIRQQIALVKGCFESPNHDDSFHSLIGAVIEDILVCGAGAIEQEIGGDLNRPLWMWPVDALSIQIYPGWSGKKDEPRYAQTRGYGNAGGVPAVMLCNDQLVYMRKDINNNDPFGYGPLEIAFNTINRLMGVSEFAGELSGNASPENILVFKGMQTDQLTKFRKWWRNEVEGQGVTPLVGGDGVEVEKLRGGSDEALFLKYQDVLKREIATAFELSPMNLGIEGDVNRNTAEVGEERDWSGAIMPVAMLLASHLNREVIAGRLGYSQIQFKWMGLEREDEELLSEIHERYYKNNVFTPNNILEKLGMPRNESEWGDRYSADVQIAVQAARGTSRDLDPGLPEAGDVPASQPSKPKSAKRDGKQPLGE